MNPIQVTFDSNVWESLVDLERLAAHPEAMSLGVVRKAIEDGQISPYFSDTLITLEAIRKTERADFLSGTRVTTTRTEVFEESPTTGASARISLEIAADFSHHPGQHEILIPLLSKAIDLGFKFIGTSRVGWLRAPDGMYKPQESNNHLLGYRIDRTCNAGRAFSERGLGEAHLRRLGDEAKEGREELRFVSPFIAAGSHPDQRAVARAIAELADGDALAAHYGHDHDVFCTLDFGRGAGRSSVLHIDHRAWLRAEFGMSIFTPSELAQHIS
ncbi:hypothetical protein [Dyella sp.]|uniref:hypothetical protein n=1 Tax=Dyella sp. TaxID=1869338 RepID=UPI0028522110|nr:hypothetical protein [Dyella sp.]MDR3447960.1 hypothetical protein [Dyella sp.]